MKILNINMQSDYSFLTSRGLKLDVTNITTSPLKFTLNYLFPVKDTNGQMVDCYTHDVLAYLMAN